MTLYWVHSNRLIAESSVTIDFNHGIIIKFHDVLIRDKLWFSKVKLKGSGITMSEFLTRSRHETFMAARERFGVNNCWTKDGYVFVIGSNKSKHRISTIGELSKIESVKSPKPAAAAAPKATTKPKRTTARK